MLLTLYCVVPLVRVSRHYITDIVFCSTLSESLSTLFLLTLYCAVPLVRVSRHYITDIVFCSTLNESLSTLYY